MSTGAGVILMLFGLLALIFNIWLFVVSVQYLRVMTRAAHRYLDLTDPETPPRN